MKNNGANRSPVLRTLGLVGVLGMAGAIVLIGPLAGSGCNEDDTSGSGNVGTGGAGGHGGVTGAGGGGGSTAVDAGGDGSVVSPTAVNVLVQNFQYMPAQFTVAPGGSIVVHNTDTMAHTMTSESATDAVTPGGVAGVSFDTGSIAPGTNATITIPANAPHGTVVPFYCTIHGKIMQGMLTIQ